MDLRFIVEKVNGFATDSPLNIAADLDRLRIFDLPLLGAADAADPLWEGLKAAAVAGGGHLSPQEWLPGARSVIAYFLPFSERVRQANRTGDAPAAEWLYGRYEGEVFNSALRNFIVETIRQAGGQAVAPVLDGRFAVANYRSNWSERHAAFVAGLGTFSLNRSLITKAGAAGRVGAIITDRRFEPTGRDYERYDEYCTGCGACIRRCPAGCISEQGKDNGACSAYLDKTLERYRPRYGCGKCQTAVPCENRRPPAKHKK